MSSGPVARWLDTFVCNNRSKQYVEIFKRYGYDTLNDICKLDMTQLIKMGVMQVDCEKIIENVSVLRQTLQANNVVYQQQQQMHMNHNQNTIESQSLPQVQKPARKKPTKQQQKQTTGKFR